MPWFLQWSEVARVSLIDSLIMMTSSNRIIFRVTGLLCGEFTGNRWIPHTKASDAELWCFLWSAPWTNGWVNKRDAGDLRRHGAHYDVILMIKKATPVETFPNRRKVIIWTNADLLHWRIYAALGWADLGYLVWYKIASSLPTAFINRFSQMIFGFILLKFYRNFSQTDELITSHWFK